MRRGLDDFRDLDRRNRHQIRKEFQGKWCQIATEQGSEVGRGSMPHDWGRDGLSSSLLGAEVHLESTIDIVSTVPMTVWPG